LPKDSPLMPVVAVYQEQMTTFKDSIKFISV
jgi:hypothetical protein